MASSEAGLLLLLIDSRILPGVLQTESSDLDLPMNRALPDFAASIRVPENRNC